MLFSILTRQALTHRVHRSKMELKEFLILRSSYGSYYIGVQRAKATAPPRTTHPTSPTPSRTVQGRPRQWLRAGARETAISLLASLQPTGGPMEKQIKNFLTLTQSAQSNIFATPPTAHARP